MSEPERSADRISESNGRGWFWLLVFLVPVVAFALAYGFSALRADFRFRDAQGVRIMEISALQAPIRLSALVFGGLTMVAFVYLLIHNRATARDAANSMESRWGVNSYRLAIFGVLLIMLVTFMAASMTLGTTDQMVAEAAKERYDVQDELGMNVVGAQWTWYNDVEGIPFGQTDTVYLPSNTLIKISITSTDVDHSWAVQELGVKKDAIPGQTNHIWLIAREPGTYTINCAELCGQGHSLMTADIVFMPKDRYISWARQNNGTVPFAEGNQTNTTTNQSASFGAPSSGEPLSNVQSVQRGDGDG